MFFHGSMALVDLGKSQNFRKNISIYTKKIKNKAKRAKRADLKLLGALGDQKGGFQELWHTLRLEQTY